MIPPQKSTYSMFLVLSVFNQYFSRIPKQTVKHRYSDYSSVIFAQKFDASSAYS